MHRQVRERLRLESDLRVAIGEERVESLYQPVVRTDTGDGRRLRGALPLGRRSRAVRRRRGGAGLIVPLGRFVFAEAARRAAEWDVSVSVNVSARQLRDPGFAGSRSGAGRQRAAPERLRLEVTESSHGRGRGGALRTLATLRDRLGVTAHLDDFGAGTSSLRFLHRFPGDALKIDRALVLDMLHDPGSLEIVKAIIGLAHNLGMEVVAKGVETAAHLEQLMLLGCEYAQGFHFAEPLTADEVRDLLDGRTAGPALV